MPQTRNKRTSAKSETKEKPMTEQQKKLREHIFRNDIQKAEDMALISNYRAQRMGYTTIMRLLNERPDRRPISIGTVFKDCQKAEKMWIEKAVTAVETGKAEMLAELEVVREEAWKIYEASKKAKTVKRAEKANSEGDGERTRQIVTIEERTGDVSALKLVIEAQERKAKLLGLDAAVKSEVTGANGMPLGMDAPQLTVIVNTPQDNRPWHEKVAEVTGRKIEPIEDNLIG
jgi:hypothetical protein